MRNPLLTMRIRPYQGHVSNPISNTYGNVRTQPVHGKPKPRVHQGWDLQAAPLTVVYAWSCPGSVDGELLSRASLHRPRGG
jgi:murein DD-endopeptidase MepM/ murein hydrolase activator NlpD